MEIGEYVRTINGDIGKINDIDTNRELYFAKDIALIIKKADIKAHSKNIIDLIEVGDIVTTNNLCGEVTKIGKDKLYLACNETCCIDNVETILTHEQYEGNSYKVVE